MPAEPVPEPPPMRQRYRAQVRGEVKQAALRQLAQSGPAGLSVSAIGKELGVSGPALYRYFASRDELLTELVIDAYHDLAEALRDAAGQAVEPGSRWHGSKRVRAAPTGPGLLPSRTGTGCCSARHCPATTRTHTGSSTPVAGRDEPNCLDVLPRTRAAHGAPASSAAGIPAFGLGAAALPRGSTRRPPCALCLSGAACTAW